MSLLWGPRNCSPISLSKASHPRLSTGDSNPHHPPFTQAQGEWLWMRDLCFGPLGGKNSDFVSSRLCLSLADKNLALFTAGGYVGGWTWHWCSVLGIPVQGPVLTPFRGKLPQLCSNLSPLPVGTEPSASGPYPSYWSRGGFCLSLVKNLPPLWLLI